MLHAPVFDDVVAAPRSADPAFGCVLARGIMLPLEEVRLHADLAGLAGLVDLRATFFNNTSIPVEATYVFPLPELGSVSSLQIRTATAVIDGWLMERAEARHRYRASLQHQDKAAILEQEREDVVTVRVGTLAPGERVSVGLVLSMRLSYSDGQIFFRFPLVVAPRHFPGAALAGAQVGAGTAADTQLVPDASRISPPVQAQNVVRLRVSIDIAADSYTIDEVGCTLAAQIIEAQSDGAQSARTLRVEALAGQRLDRDLVLRLRVAAHGQPSLSLLTNMDGDGPEGTFALTVLPPTLDQAARSARDVVVVVDVSAPMSGWRRSATRRAAAQIIDSLAPTDRFSVLLFADAVNGPGWDGLAPATDRNRFRAIEHLIATPAHGNPELLGALESASELLNDPGRPSILVVITGGHVGNEDQIASAFTLRTGVVRVHTIGVGAAVNAGLLQRLATAGRGEMLLVENETALDDVIPNLLRLLGSAFLTDLNLAGEEMQLLTNTISPSRPPDVFSGIASVITGRFRGSANGSVTVSGTGVDGQPWASRVTATPVDGRALTQLWARAFLADLHHRYLRCRIEDAPGLERLIITTSLRFGVLTRLTAFVAVSNAPARTLGAPSQVIQSVEMPSDWTELGPSLSPYEVEYARILAATRNSVASQGPSQPIRTQPSPPTAEHTTPYPAGYGAATGESAVPQISPAPPPSAPPGYAPRPSAPGAPFPAPPSYPRPPISAAEPAGPMPPSPPRQSGSRLGRYIGAGAGAIVVATGISVAGVTMTEKLDTTTSAPSTHATTTRVPTTTTTTKPTSSRTATNVDPRTGARIDVTLTPRGSGSRLTAHVSGIPKGSRARMIVVGRDGTKQPVTQWVIEDSTSTKIADSTFRIDEIDSVAIEDQSGQSYVSVSFK